MRLVTLGLLGSLVACDGGNPFGGCPNSDLLLELGTGESDLQLLDNGDDASIIRGGQGGFHVDAAGRIGPIGQEVDIIATLTIPSAPGSPEVGNGRSSRALANYDDPSCSGEFWGLRVVMNAQNSTEQRIQQMRGREGILDVTVVDLNDEESISESLSVMLTFSPQ